ncbi:hypothetical protein [Tengunoibacter tsumagoiensis]|uniref:Uncharacterized protein n=1 Tax=Tengunoibacter tsumagoiensis TaxID=2014871 RepID=A0A401ZVP8_9CHLR|nr:hypothetical protein [Tengunoibacter tsumagoiensis]GCE10988.1 hypothetical protein KTT_08470 [Tengunoibacter tsumagoiensis]
MTYDPPGLSMGDLIWIIVYYLAPVITLIFLPILWFVYPLFLLFAFVYGPRRPKPLYHYLQAFLSCVCFFICVIISVILGAIFLHNAEVLSSIALFDLLLIFASFIFALFMVGMIALDRPASVPGIAFLAHKYVKLRTSRPSRQFPRRQRQL